MRNAYSPDDLPTHKFCWLLRLGGYAERKDHDVKGKDFIFMVFHALALLDSGQSLLLDYRIRSRQQIWWNRQADLLGRFEINHQLKF